MSEAIETVIETVDVVENVVEPTSSDPFETQARSQGWVPEDEYKVEGKPWRTAREFVERGEMIGEIRSMRSEMEGMRSSMRETLDQQAKAIRKGMEDKYRKDLETAVDEGDKVAAAKAADELAKINTPEIPQEDPSVAAFKTRNKWFSEEAADPVDKEMTEIAIALDMALDKGGNKNTQNRLKLVEERLQRIFPEKFTNPARGRVQAVEPGGQIRRAGKRSVPALDSLGPDFVNVGKKMVRQGVFKTESDYVQSLIDAGAIDV